MPAHIAFLLPYPLHRAPSQRFRVENLLPLLEDAGCTYDLHPFMDEATWNVLYKGGSGVQKVKGIMAGYWRRMRTVALGLRKADFVFIHREAAPLGPPVFEWWIRFVLGKKIIYDFDDAIWIPNTSAQNRIAAWLKACWKIGKICKWSYKVAAGNAYLARFAAVNAPQVVQVPTIVDTQNRYNLLKQHRSVPLPTIGWTGSHSTLKFLDEVMPVLGELQQEFDFEFIVIADKRPDLPLRNWRFIPWNERTEIEDLQQIDIGIMPLTNDAWSEGKCGFKLIQYLALGIPAVASPVGVNSTIIREGENGFLATTPADWKTYLQQLMTDAGLRTAYGRNGREWIIREYSRDAIRERFLKLFT